jgi:hypothetical protein
MITSHLYEFELVVAVTFSGDLVRRVTVAGEFVYDLGVVISVSDMTRTHQSVCLVGSRSKMSVYLHSS